MEECFSSFYPWC